MPLDAAERAEALNVRFAGQTAQTILREAVASAEFGAIALVSSFGAESVVLLHMVSRIERSLPILFLDTQMLFPETIAYQQAVVRQLSLTDVRVHTPGPRSRSQDPSGKLHRDDPDACCTLRKTSVLQDALAGFDAWITGRKRFQGGQRRALERFEMDAESGRLKINPLAHWSVADIQGYIADHRLPRHPLVARGYGSIGCAPCTSPISIGEDQRAGRWRGEEKSECGIHISEGRVSRRRTAA